MGKISFGTIYRNIGLFPGSILMLNPFSIAAGKRIGLEAKDSDPMTGQALYLDVVAYTSFKLHRTGIKGDLGTSKWMGDALSKAGLSVELKSWRLKQFFIEECSLLVNGEKIKSFPAWYPKDTNSGPVTGRLALFDEDKPSNMAGHIVLAGDDYAVSAGSGVNEEAEIAADAGAVGLVIVSIGSESGLLAAANAKRKDPKLDNGEYFQTSLPLPTLIVAEKDYSKLAEAAEKNMEASIAIKGRHEPDTEALNVLATLKRGEKWIVVTTPSSGWFTCGGERGPGVALFMGLARWAARTETKHSFIFIANSGHELDNMGAHLTLEQYLPDRGISPENVTVWLHLGASIANRKWQKSPAGFTPLNQPGTIFLSGTKSLYPHLDTAFAGVEGYNIGHDLYAGELRAIINSGFNAFGFFGGNYFFHQREDKEHSTTPEFLESVAAALLKVLSKMDQL